VPVNVKTACVIDAPNKIRVTAATPGFLSEILVRDGSRISQGDPLVLLTNLELEKNLHQLRLQEEAVLASEAEAVSRQMDARIPALRALASQYGLAVAKYSADLEKLRVTAPASGTVLAKGLRDQKGTFLREGFPILAILPEGPLEVVVALSEKQAGTVRAGQSATFRIHSLPGEEWAGTVRSVSSSPSIELPHQSLGQHAGGTVPAVLSSSNSISQSDNTPVALPSGQVYKARIAIEDPDGTLRPGMGGRLKIQAGSKPLGSWLSHSVRDMLRADFQL
jgi:multidrug resistance efflux pump